MNRNKGRFYEAGHFKWDTITRMHLSGPLLLNNINSLNVGLNDKDGQGPVSVSVSGQLLKIVHIMINVCPMLMP